MRYEAGNCAIVVSINDVMIFNLGHIYIYVAVGQRL